MRPNDRYKVSESRTVYKLKGRPMMYSRRNRGAGGVSSGGAKVMPDFTPRSLIRYSFNLVKHTRYMLIHYCDIGDALAAGNEDIIADDGR